MFKVYIHKTQNEKEAGIKRRKTYEPSKLSIDPAFYVDVKNDLLPL